MEIQINDYNVDFEFEEEKTISEVIDSISEWTQQRDLVFTEARINDENYSIDNMPNIPLQDVNVLNCYVKSKADIIISSLNEGIDYCKKIHQFIDNSIQENNIDNSEIKNIVSGIEWLIEVLNKVSQLLNIDYNTVLYKDNPVQEYIGKAIAFKKIDQITNQEKLLKFLCLQYC